VFKPFHFTRKSLLITTMAFALGSALTVVFSADSLTVQDNGRKLYQVQQVRPSYGMKEILGMVPLGDNTGCYIVWNRTRVEVYKTGWLQDGSFDSTRVWWMNFNEDVRHVMPIGDKTSAFVVQTINSHTVYKVDWYNK